MTEDQLAARIHTRICRGLRDAAAIITNGCGCPSCVGEALTDTLSDVHAMVALADPGVCAGANETIGSILLTGQEIPLFPEVQL